MGRYILRIILGFVFDAFMRKRTLGSVRSACLASAWRAPLQATWEIAMGRPAATQLLRICSACAWCFLSPAMYAESAAEEAMSSIKVTFNRLHAINVAAVDLPEKAGQIATIYAQQIEPLQRLDNVGSLKTDDIELLFRSADTASFYLMKSAYVEDMELDLRVLASHGVVEEWNYAELYGAYVGLREFDKARQLAASHPKMAVAALPEITLSPLGSSSHEVLRVSNSDGSVRNGTVDIGHGAVILVVGHPHCHFSQDAIAAIKGNRTLEKLFKEHSRWITPPARALDDQAIREWNARHDFAKYDVAYSRDAWPGIDTWETPVFYFYRDGVLRDTVIGWPKGGNLPALEHGIRSIGIPSEMPH
jgi:hypothetical protein